MKSLEVDLIQISLFNEDSLEAISLERCLNFHEVCDDECDEVHEICEDSLEEIERRVENEDFE
jgi:hypothetical protein